MAVIGARAADRPGNHAAYSIARNFANEGFVIVSGLALGCDTSAHRASIDVNDSNTVIDLSDISAEEPGQQYADFSKTTGKSR